jgi:hypothetical protein
VIIKVKMKYFSKINNVDIISEMFNLEAGAEVCKNGKIVENPKKANKYPIYTVDGISTCIKTCIAYVYIKDISITSFIDMCAKEMDKLEEEYKKKTGYSHLTVSNIKQLSHFVNVKHKNLKSKMAPVRYMHNSLYGDIDKETQKNSRFIWVFMSFKKLIENIDNRWQNMHLSSQLISIIIDEDNLITKPNGYVFPNNITFADFNFTKNLSNLTRIGYITNEKINDDNTEIYSCFNDMIKFPEFIPAWHGFNYISFCSMRYFDIEIHKHLKKEGMDQVDYHVFLELHNIPIYQVSFKDITINNLVKRNDQCYCCEANLYGDIYMLFDDYRTNIGKAYCHICMHSIVVVEISLKKMVVARVTYPRTLLQVLNGVLIDETVRRLCMTNKSDIVTDDNAVFLKDSYNKEYLLWAGNISDLYVYLNKPNYITKKYKRAEKIQQYLNTVEIVKIHAIKANVVFLEQ